MHVLVVDDNPINRKVASKLLTNLQCRVDVVGSGRKALDQVRNVDYDLIFMDVQMPDLDGLETTALIRQQQRNPAVPIVAMTAYAMDNDRLRCLQSGMDDYLSKPIDKHALRALLDRYRYRPAK